MEQLATYGNKAVAGVNHFNREIDYYEAKRIISAKLEHKIRFELSQAQIESFDQIMTNYIKGIPLDSFINKALVFSLFKLYSKHIEPKTAKTQKKFKISLNLAEAKVLINMIDDIDYINYGPFESGLLLQIFGEIDRQS